MKKIKALISEIDFHKSLTSKDFIIIIAITDSISDLFISSSVVRKSFNVIYLINYKLISLSGTIAN